MDNTFKLNVLGDLSIKNSKISLNSNDPYDHLPPKEWVEKQIEWGEKNISGIGLLSILNSLGENLVGCEIGVCLGTTTEFFAKNLNNLKTLYAVDNYPSFTDWNGVLISQERQNEMKKYASNRLSSYNDKVKLVYKTSLEFSLELKKEQLDFIFIDGDHSEAGAYNDFVTYYPLIKSGGVFAGHDLNIPTVNSALKRFFGGDLSKIIQVENTAWYVIK